MTKTFGSAWHRKGDQDIKATSSFFLFANLQIDLCYWAIWLPFSPLFFWIADDGTVSLWKEAGEKEGKGREGKGREGKGRKIGKVNRRNEIWNLEAKEEGEVDHGLRISPFPPLRIQDFVIGL